VNVATTDRRPVVLWFRRDLRLGDHPALVAAARQGPVVALFVLDDALLRTAGRPRLAYLLRTLRALEHQLGTHGATLTLRRGRPEQVVPSVVAEAGAAAVHITADFAPYGTVRDQRVAAALGAVPLLATGSPYAVAPTRIRRANGDAYQVFTAFYRSWLANGWDAPTRSDPSAVEWRTIGGEPIPDDPPISATLPDAGESAARRAWARFRRDDVTTYAGRRDHPALDGTSRMSPFLKVGAVHPRTLLADLGADDDAFRRQLAWREFYATVLHHVPSTARACFQPRMEGMEYDSGPQADTRFAVWATGRTGSPLVDAGMRQLLAEGWMHNRVRMITASFLVKDLHIDWTRGARHFMDHLIDGDLASNQHGWQWTAGTGTDAAPYFRIFNPVSQSRKFDPDGGYIRRWVPELAALPGDEIHEPWRRSEGVPPGYPEPIIEHRRERADSLARYHLLRSERDLVRTAPCSSH
jgi:deoxyribodipyrimidine photo-lyase